MTSNDNSSVSVPLLDATPVRKPVARLYAEEIGGFCAKALPVSVQYINYTIFIGIIQMLVGKQSTAGLAAVALGIQLNRAVGFFVISNLNSASETIAGQALGANEPRLVGLILQRAILINLLFMLPLVVLSFNSEKLLLLLWQPPEVASIVQEFMVTSLAASIAEMLADVCTRYLSFNVYFWPIVAGQCVSLPSGIATGFLLISSPENAIRGAGLATMAYSGTSLPILLVGIVCLHKKSKRAHGVDSIWPGFSAAAFQGWGHFLTIGGASLLMFSPKQFYMEYLFLIVGTLPEKTAASTAIAVSMFWIVAAIALSTGFRCVAAGSVGNAVGSGDVEKITTRVRAQWWFGVFAGTVQAALLVGFEEQLSKLWTADTEVLDILTTLKWPTAGTILCTWVVTISLGILSGFRRNSWGVWAAVPSYLLLGFGLAPVLILKMGLGTIGGSLSYTLVLACEGGILIVMLWLLNFSKECARVEESLARAKGSL